MKIGKRVDLRYQDLEKLKVIGAGKEGVVYDAKNGYLYKVYYQSMPKVDTSNIVRDEDGVIISKPILLPEKVIEMGINYIDVEGVAFRNKDAIKMAIRKQEDVKYTYLPVAPIYIRDRYSGCVVKKIRGAVGIHNTRILPINTRIKILKQLQKKVEELLDNYIYPVDLANKPDGNGGHSNILVNYKLEPHLIDVDGKSTIYRGSLDKLFLSRCITNLITLYLDILYDVDLSLDLMDVDLDYIIYELKNKGMPSEYIDSFIHFNADIEMVNSFINSPKILKRK